MNIMTKEYLRDVKHKREQEVSSRTSDVAAELTSAFLCRWEPKHCLIRHHLEPSRASEGSISNEVPHSRGNWATFLAGATELYLLLFASTSKATRVVVFKADFTSFFPSSLLFTLALS